MNKKHLILGIDGGGSSSDAAIYELDGRIIDQALIGPLSCKSSSRLEVLKSLEKLFSFVEAYIPQIQTGVFALSGLDSKEDYERMVELLIKAGFCTEAPECRDLSFAKLIDGHLGFQIVLCSDALLPLFANGVEAGSVLISGTGSVALNLSSEGKLHRFGGWGYFTSDEGSGTWIGMQYLREVLHACDRVKSFIASEGFVGQICEQEEHFFEQDGRICDAFAGVNNINEGISDDTHLIDQAWNLIFKKFEDAPCTKNELSCEGSHAVQVFTLAAKIDALVTWSIGQHNPKRFASLAKDVIQAAYSGTSCVCKEIISEACEKLTNLAYLAFSELSPTVVLAGGLFKSEHFAGDVKDKILELSAGKAKVIVNERPPTSGALGIGRGVGAIRP